MTFHLLTATTPLADELWCLTQKRHPVDEHEHLADAGRALRHLEQALWHLCADAMGARTLTGDQAAEILAVSRRTLYREFDRRGFYVTEEGLPVEPST